jgi:hypothetical protein
MAALLTAATASTDGTGASHSGPCSVFVRGTLAGAQVAIEVADENVAASYVKPSKAAMPESRFSEPGSVTLNAYGTYFVRARLVGATATTNVTVVTTQ